MRGQLDGPASALAEAVGAPLCAASGFTWQVSTVELAEAVKPSFAPATAAMAEDWAALGFDTDADSKALKPVYLLERQCPSCKVANSRTTTCLRQSCKKW